MGRKIKVGAAIAIVAVAVVGTFEGLETKTYRDIVGVPTVCYGETRGVKIGDKYTKEQCDAMLIARLGEFEDGVRKCNKYDMTDKQLVANVSLAYNIGLGAYCKSTVVRKFNQGKVKEGCHAFLLFVKAGGRRVKGLVTRRQEEKKICLG